MYLYTGRTHGYYGVCGRVVPPPHGLCEPVLDSLLLQAPPSVSKQWRWHHANGLVTLEKTIGQTGPGPFCSGKETVLIAAVGSPPV